MQLQNVQNFKICIDHDRLKQILMNLISNGIKFTERGGHVKVNTKFVRNADDLTVKDNHQLNDSMKNAQHGALEIQVIDNGCGINEQGLSRLFKLFGFLEDSEQLNTKGIGLGLYICRQIVQKFGGEIICRSKVG